MSENKHTIQFKIEGMTCASCAFHARRALESIDGVKSAHIDSWHNGNAEIEAASDDVDTEQISEVLTEVGYTAIF
ncbi:MAG: hypothetical protein D6737_00865 [Chloroflexi bacterium]|nr:MAG: hypothetical protein D6737_00865 [Chloroflexota bacterium]